MALYIVNEQKGIFQKSHKWNDGFHLHSSLSPIQIINPEIITAHTTSYSRRHHHTRIANPTNSPTIIPLSSFARAREREFYPSHLARKHRIKSRAQKQVYPDDSRARARALHLYTPPRKNKEEARRARRIYSPRRKRDGQKERRERKRREREKLVLRRLSLQNSFSRIKGCQLPPPWRYYARYPSLSCKSERWNAVETSSLVRASAASLFMPFFLSYYSSRPSLNFHLSRSLSLSLVSRVCVCVYIRVYAAGSSLRCI